MEVSICIPVYNCKVIPLVKELVKQGDALPHEYEICLLDDGSEERIKLQNRELLEFEAPIRYEELPENIGRAKIRNRLAEMAKGEWFLFLDCDVLVRKDDFLDCYLATQEALVTCGGCKYPKHLNIKNHELRYLYGKEVEEIQVKDGIVSSPFLTGNFMVHHSVFSEIQFDESLEKYGYEDALFAIEFEKTFQQEIEFIDNPVEINHIDTNEEFLFKTKQAAENLAQLYSKRRVILGKNIRLLIAYNQLKSNGLLSILEGLGKTTMPLLTYNLLSAKPSLKLFQFYKLIHFSEAIKTINN